MLIAQDLILTSLWIIITLIGIRLLIEFILSYNQSSFNKNKFFFRYLFMLTEPFYIPFRKILPPAQIVDISPIIAIAALMIIYNLLVRIFFYFDKVLQIT